MLRRDELFRFSELRSDSPAWFSRSATEFGRSKIEQ